MIAQKAVQPKSVSNRGREYQGLQVRIIRTRPGLGVFLYLPSLAPEPIPTHPPTPRAHLHMHLMINKLGHLHHVTRLHALKPVESQGISPHARNSAPFGRKTNHPSTYEDKPAFSIFKHLNATMAEQRHQSSSRGQMTRSTSCRPAQCPSSCSVPCRSDFSPGQSGPCFIIMGPKGNGRSS